MGSYQKGNTTGSENVHILVIAPYIGLARLFEDTASRREDICLTAYVSDTTEAAVFIKSLPVEDYDIIISRGYTCQMIQAACGRHVLDVGISIYDMLRTIRLAQNYNGRFAVVGFKSVIYFASILKEVLRYNFDIFTVESTEEIGDVLAGLKSMGYTMIVGDVITTKIAKGIGLQTILITTSPESIDAVLNNGLSLYWENMEYKRELKFFKEIAGGNRERLAVFDEEGHLTFSTLSENPELMRSLKKYIPTLAPGQESCYVKTSGSSRFTIRARIMDRGTSSRFVFYIKESEYLKKGSFLLSFLGTDNGPAVSQRIFYTLTPSLKAALSEAEAFRFFSRPILISGPRGSGKDSFAFFLYQNGSQTHRPMAVIDCNFAEDKEWNLLINHEDSPLFASGYTIFFKDVHQLGEQQQKQLLSLLRHTALQKRNQLIFSSASGISTAFNQSLLKEEIVGGLHALTITIPSLNERREDIPNLATLYLSEFNSQMARQAIAFEKPALRLLQEFDWSGNLFQLRSVIQELILCAESSYITADEVRQVLRKSRSEAVPSVSSSSVSLDGTLDEITRRVVAQVLQEEHMNQTSAAKRLNIGRSTLRRHLL